ncbi:MAG: hypothetical protein R2865_14045 [Deinococcales bacterium]
MHIFLLVLDLKPTADRSYNRESLPWQSHELSFEQENNGDMVLLYQDLYKTLNEGIRTNYQTRNRTPTDSDL